MQRYGHNAIDLCLCECTVIDNSISTWFRFCLSTKPRARALDRTLTISNSLWVLPHFSRESSQHTMHGVQCRKRKQPAARRAAKRGEMFYSYQTMYKCTVVAIFLHSSALVPLQWIRITRQRTQNNSPAIFDILLLSSFVWIWTEQKKPKTKNTGVCVCPPFYWKTYNMLCITSDIA